MHRRALLDLLSRYEPADPHEVDAKRRIESFVRDHADCFRRELAVGHITGSAWVLDATLSRVLLTHHKKLNLWLQLGGHCDGDPNVLAVALREAREESGIDHIVPLSAGIFDVDVHEIPAHGDVPAHLHHDIRFAMFCPSDDCFTLSPESNALQWFDHASLAALAVDRSVRRMATKWSP